jgi:hypothetical protein
MKKHHLPTKEQQKALLELYRRSDVPQSPTFLKFRRNAFWEFGGKALMVPWCGMIVGIEPDGYTHS